jgi:TolA-binding protein
MEQLDYNKILEKIGLEKDLSRLTEEELLFYDMVKAIKSKSADDEKLAIQEAIKIFKQQEIKITLNKNENQVNMKTNNRTWIGIAAGIAILVVAYFLFWNPGKSTDEMYAESFKPESEHVAKARENSMQFGMASATAESRDSFLNGLKLYESNKYDESMKILAPYVENYPEDNDARFYLAMSQMNREKYAPAITHLSILNAKTDLDASLLEEVKWYYALCSLKMVDGKKQAKVLFEQLAASEGKHARVARANLAYL